MRVRTLIAQALEAAVAAQQRNEWDRAEEEIRTLGARLREEPAPLRAWAFSFAAGEATDAMGKQRVTGAGVWAGDDEMTMRRYFAASICRDLLRRLLPLGDAELIQLVRAANGGALSCMRITATILRQLESSLAGGRPGTALLEELRLWLKRFGVDYGEDGVSLRSRLRRLVEGGDAPGEKAPRPACAADEVVKQLLAEAERAGEAVHVGRACSMECAITPEQALERSPQERVRLLHDIAKGSVGAVHLARLAAARSGFAGTQALAPELAAILEALLYSVAGRIRATCSCGAMASRSPGDYSITQERNWQVHEALWIAGSGERRVRQHVSFDRRAAERGMGLSVVGAASGIARG